MEDCKEETWDDMAQVNDFYTLKDMLALEEFYGDRELENVKEEQWIQIEKFYGKRPCTYFNDPLEMHRIIGENDRTAEKRSREKEEDSGFLECEGEITTVEEANKKRKRQ
jgi:hypothetical protein